MYILNKTMMINHEKGNEGVKSIRERAGTQKKGCNRIMFMNYRVKKIAK